MSCIVCNNDKLEKIKNYNYLDNSIFKELFPDLCIYECNKCGLKQINHSLIDPDKLDEYYKTGYRADGSHTAVSKKDCIWYKARAKGLFDFFQKNVHNTATIKKIFEIGAGYGFNLIEFAKNFSEVDLYTDEPNIKTQHCLKEHNIKFKSLSEDKYDLVIMSHVLEHIIFPLNIINKIESGLNSKGYLLIEVPNQPNISFINNSEEPHVTFFEPDSIRFIFEKFYREKFKIISIATAGPCVKDFYCKQKNFINYMQLLFNKITDYSFYSLDFSCNDELTDRIFLRILLQKI